MPRLIVWFNKHFSFNMLFFPENSKKEEPYGLFLFTRKRYSTLYSTPSPSEAKHIFNMLFSATL